MRIRGEVFWQWADPSLHHRTHDETLGDGTPNNDFRGDYLRAKLEMPEDYPMDGWQKFTMSAKVWGSYVLNFATYPMVAAVLVLALYWVWVGFGPATGESVATLQSPQKQSMSSAK